MSKSVIFVFAIAAAIGCLEAKMTMDEARDAMLAIGKTCIDETGASPEDIAQLKAKEPESKGAKCLTACMYKGMGIIKDGKYNVEGVMAAGKMLYEEGSAELDKVKAIAEACASVADADECELAGKAIACEMPKITEAGLEMPV